MVPHLVLLLSTLVPVPTAGNPPSTVAQVFDGAPRDLAADGERVWLAQGRNLAVLDGRDGKRIPDDPASPFPVALAAIEIDPASGTRIVATVGSVRIERPGIPALTWTPAASEVFPTIRDVKFRLAGNHVFVVAGNRIAVLDASGPAIVKISEAQVPSAACLGLSRLLLARSGARLIAYALGTVPHGTVPRVKGVYVFDLDLEHGFANPAYLGLVWSPADAYADPLASSSAIQIAFVPGTSTRFAYVADGTSGLSRLDVSVPGQASLVQRIAIGPPGSGIRVTNLLLEPDRRRLHVAASDGLHVIDTESNTEMGFAPASLGNGGDLDMAFEIRANGTRRLWTATNTFASWPVHGFDVTAATPVDLCRRVWVESSDGAVAVPAWNSIYLPTWSGVVRYDVSDLLHPRMVESSYRPAEANTEQIEILWPHPSDTNHALLLTAPGNGGVQTWAISSNDPDPAPPRRWTRLPSAWGPNPNVYENDVEGYRFGGRCYALCDLSNLNTGEVALQAYDVDSGACVNAFESSPVLHGFSSDVCAVGNFAFVGCRGGFFAVRLDGLPASIAVVGQTLVDGPASPIPTIVQSIAADEVHGLLFVATDVRDAVLSYAFDPATGAVSGPLGVLTSPGLTGCVGRCRYVAATRRLYVASRHGIVAEIDVSDPLHMVELSSWHSPGYDGPMQDVHVYDFGTGPRILAVKDSESFAILDPDDGL